MDRYAIEQHPNRQLASFHLTCEVPGISMFSSDEITDKATRFKEALLAIPGVVEVMAAKQCVRIARGGAYSWTELKDAVLAVFVEHLDLDAPEEVSPYPTGAGYIFNEPMELDDEPAELDN